jgi:LPS sulfotransferase NodH
MGDPREWYNANEPQFSELDKQGLPFMRHLAEKTATANGVFGIKVLLGCLGRFGIAAEWPAIRNRFSPRIIWLRRRDTMRQAISRYRAKQTDEWARTTIALPHRPPRFDAAEIWRNYDQLVAWEADWAREFRELAVQPLQVWYEEVLSNPQSAVDAICRLVGVKAPAVDPERCPMAIQRDEVTEMWTRRLTA